MKDVTVSLRRLVGGEGIEGSFPQHLSPAEDEALHASAAVIRQAIDELDRAG